MCKELNQGSVNITTDTSVDGACSKGVQQADICSVQHLTQLVPLTPLLTHTHTQVDPASKALVRAAHDSLMAAVGACKPGVRFRDLGDIISKHVSSAG
jgi:methionine aminopeptidase